MSSFANWTDFSSTHAGLAAALRRAFKPPEDGDANKFEELLRGLN